MRGINKSTMSVSIRLSQEVWRSMKCLAAKKCVTMSKEIESVLRKHLECEGELNAKDD